MEKRLSRPPIDSSSRNERLESNVSADMGQKRDLAKRRAMDKVRARTMAKQQQLAERIATATEQLASGIDEASSAAAELGSAMAQVATGADEAASAAEQSRAAINQIQKAAVIANDLAKDSLDRTNSAQALVKSTSNDIDKLVDGIKEAAETNFESTKLVADLEQQSKEIGNIVDAVVRIADQTNLLALNAAIEAARAGEHGRGFAVVADEVRNLAEISEKSARDIRELVNEIQDNVKVVVQDVEEAGNVANTEVERGKKITEDLLIIGTEMAQVQAGVTEVTQNAKTTNEGSKDFLGMSEQIAAAAEEQGSAAEEVNKSVAEQNKAFNEMGTAANELAQMAEQLKVSTDSQKTSEELAAAAEELSANVEEANSASQQIMVAMVQLGKGARIQGELSISGAELAERLVVAATQMKVRSEESVEKVNELQSLLGGNKKAVDEMIFGITKSSEASMASAQNIKILEDTTRKIDKIVDAIVNVTIQTNMLAVNGSIEAARAGEFGRGFSVVAGDIRTLANESADNADKIKDLVRNIQNQIQKVTGDIELSAKTATQEVLNAKKSTQNLNVIEENMNIILKGVKEVSKGSEESLVALEQARKGVDQIATAAQEAEKAVTESNTAAQEQAKGMQELAEAIEEISGLADELQTM
ncbi:methyl-accepting chemotaxis protein [Desulfosporosinus hippei]|uniref:Methyl-accepting chemotaxis protein n=1 Tax=Desulfosporosinus hippei DSM 8344 TaxID=1121419 RepID=A0A1G7WCJ0_9FIRM|nr:methyl-accepting chemotaxis protein [Desulfosporosinus hippei]SDG69682.1 methyl-accepting chemotaxis protein [Desulfosporosinus hippei DSM 8344]